ncbi:hypothetical protein [Candidatus Parabeggiatoa sp. HSG14]|uniref:hypothetical protein n=1 Tax=Candidatus Parabeggiatoa sp. HSG14 TaxID=3055593 RepID=UPI0025A84105|nr:hypothetical protein [Thiotrichales bacterium HSG14]
MSVFLLIYSTYAYTSPIKSDEIVIFFPTIAYPLKGEETWALHIHGWIYEPEWGGSVRQQIRRLFNWKNDEKEDDNSIFNKRMGAFFVDNERGKEITIFLGKKRFRLNKSTANGHFGYTTLTSYRS